MLKLKLQTLGEVLEEARKEARKKPFKYGQWKVLSDGTLKCTERDYIISGSRLRKGDWLYHLNDKDWVNLNDFVPAYFKALELRGINKIEIRISYAQ